MIPSTGKVHETVLYDQGLGGLFFLISCLKWSFLLAAMVSAKIIYGEIRENRDNIPKILKRAGCSAILPVAIFVYIGCSRNPSVPISEVIFWTWAFLANVWGFSFILAKVVESVAQRNRE